MVDELGETLETWTRKDKIDLPDVLRDLLAHRRFAVRAPDHGDKPWILVLELPRERKAGDVLREHRSEPNDVGLGDLVLVDQAAKKDVESLPLLQHGAFHAVDLRR